MVQAPDTHSQTSATTAASRTAGVSAVSVSFQNVVSQPCGGGQVLPPGTSAKVLAAICPITAESRREAGESASSPMLTALYQGRPEAQAERQAIPLAGARSVAGRPAAPAGRR